VVQTIDYKIVKAEIVLTTETAAIGRNDLIKIGGTPAVIVQLGPTRIVIIVEGIDPNGHIRIATIVAATDLKDLIKIVVIPEVIVQRDLTKTEIVGAVTDHSDRITIEIIAAATDHRDRIKIEKTETRIVRKGHPESENLAKDQSFTRKPNDSTSIWHVAA
jgi:hypothetical protein